MQYENFTTTPCDVILSNSQQTGIITNEHVKAFVCTPNNGDTLETIHLSADELILQFISQQVEKFPDTQILIKTNNSITEFFINEQGLITTKD